MESDKDLIRQGRYAEALGENYVADGFIVFLMRDGICFEHLKGKDGEDKHFYSHNAAEKYVEKKIKKGKLVLAENEHWCSWNINSDWL